MSKPSKKYTKNFQTLQSAIAINKSEIFTVPKAVELILSLEQPTFQDGPTLEIHFKLNIDTTKSDQLVRSNVVLPNGSGKAVKIAAFVNPESVEMAKKLGCYKVGSDDLIEEIKNGGKVDFDIAIAQPEMMKKLPAIARVLGTAGVMPNPKTGTIGDDIEALVKLINSGKVDFKNDKTGNIHFSVGKINSKFDSDKLVANVDAAIDAVEKAKPDAIKKKYITSIHIASTMSPSIKLK